MHTSHLCKWLLIGTVTFIAAWVISPVQGRTGETIDDLGISSKIKAALLNDPSTHPIDINVETFNGIVQLSGFIPTITDKQKVAQIAASINGVRGVQNELVVR